MVLHAKVYACQSLVYLVNIGCVTELSEKITNDNKTREILVNS